MLVGSALLEKHSLSQWPLPVQSELLDKKQELESKILRPCPVHIKPDYKAGLVAKISKTNLDCTDIKGKTVQWN